MSVKRNAKDKLEHSGGQIHDKVPHRSRITEKQQSRMYIDNRTLTSHWTETSCGVSKVATSTPLQRTGAAAPPTNVTSESDTLSECVAVHTSLTHCFKPPKNSSSSYSSSSSSTNDLSSFSSFPSLTSSKASRQEAKSQGVRDSAVACHCPIVAPKELAASS